ncbi:hypothetical protein HDC94_000717 [Leifsonia sp. AK011]|nr:hypothetical protein [Leifsonia sp. AK011]
MDRRTSRLVTSVALVGIIVLVAIVWFITR